MLVLQVMIDKLDKQGVTVRPKLYIAAGISGAVQHRAGMEESSQIISINTDPDAPINTIADFTIIGDVSEVVPRMIKTYREVSNKLEALGLKLEAKKILILMF